MRFDIPILNYLYTQSCPPPHPSAYLSIPSACQQRSIWLSYTVPSHRTPLPTPSMPIIVLTHMSCTSSVPWNCWKWIHLHQTLFLAPISFFYTRYSFLQSFHSPSNPHHPTFYQSNPTVTKLPRHRFHLLLLLSLHRFLIFFLALPLFKTPTIVIDSFLELVLFSVSQFSVAFGVLMPLQPLATILCHFCFLSTYPTTTTYHLPPHHPFSIPSTLLRLYISRFPSCACALSHALSSYPSFFNRSICSSPTSL